VITPVEKPDYDTLRDYAYLSASARLAKTLVLQVDEFWKPARPEMFADLTTYFSDRILGEGGDKYEDHYGLFWRDRIATVAGYASKTYSRQDLFWISSGDQGRCDRIPFTWDFGFLLLAHDDWYSSTDESLQFLSATSQEDVRVGHVLASLRMPKDALQPAPNFRQFNPSERWVRPLTSWRAVLEASTTVSRRRKARDSSAVNAFDIARPASESFSCTVLEIWFSEILEHHFAYDRDREPEAGEPGFLKWISSKGTQFSLIDLVKAYRVELYMTWMLLIESIDLQSFINRDNRFAFTAESPAAAGITVRHWYKTACEAKSISHSEGPAMPARLPGFFSTRGDWGLALAAGSRSNLLGTRGLDFLNSRRAHIARLQQGIGLPARDIGHPEGLDMFRTRLSYINEHAPSGHASSRRATLGLSGLIELGADETVKEFREKRGAEAVFSDVPNESGESFYWLRRSLIEHYGRNSKIWQRWLLRVMLAMEGIATSEAPKWQSGFEVYDILAKARRSQRGAIPDAVEALRTYQRFNRLVDCLIKELEWHTRAR
jgi:hypothetical protein